MTAPPGRNEQAEQEAVAAARETALLVRRLLLAAIRNRDSQVMEALREVLREDLKDVIDSEIRIYVAGHPDELADRLLFPGGLGEKRVRSVSAEQAAMIWEAYARAFVDGAIAAAKER